MNLYHFILTIPERLYPGGMAAYERMLAEGHHATTIAYREIFHLAGGGLVLVIALLLERLFASPTIFAVIMIALVAFITFQEFYLHPTFWGQSLTKSVLDWAAWLLPSALYLLTHWR